MNELAPITFRPSRARYEGVYITPWNRRYRVLIGYLQDWTQTADRDGHATITIQRAGKDGYIDAYVRNTDTEPYRWSRTPQRWQEECVRWYLTELSRDRRTS